MHQMSHMSDNYKLRMCYLERDEVPTQTVIKKHMGNSLANVYFKSMSPKLKVVAGLEPSLKGGGADWYMPPAEILKGRAVLKPTTRKLLQGLTNKSIGIIGEEMFERHRKALKAEVQRAIDADDENWRNILREEYQMQWSNLAAEAKKKNSEVIQTMFNSFAHLYRRSLDKFESLFHEAAIAEISKTRQNAIQYMQEHYEKLLKKQAVLLYDEYENKFNNEKARLKSEFIKKLEEARTEMTETLHDLRLEKHMAVEKLRQYFECQNLACLVYVALKERQEYMKEIEESKKQHRKIVKVLDEDLAYKNMEVRLEQQRQAKRAEFDEIMRKKVCRVVKMFQLFVTYCLKSLPEYADFFINMEKLMLLQISQVLEEPKAESIIEIEEEEFHTPIPLPNPFYLFCDRGYKTQVSKDLCPKHCTSSASQLPAIIINKKCMYAACDNFEQFTNKLQLYISGKRGDDDDFVDSIKSAECVPVKYASSQQLLELKLETSLTQLLQQEMSNVQELPIKCGFCGTSHCFCRPGDKTPPRITYRPEPLPITPKSSHHATPLTREMELHHEREPKVDSYLKYVDHWSCSCTKTAKKNVAEHLPAYMRLTSKYDRPEIPNYEMCTVDDLKRLVKEARGPSTPSSVSAPPSKTKDEGTQYVDPEFDDIMCTCFSDTELKRFLSDLTIKLSSIKTNGQLKVVGASESPSFLVKTPTEFATDRAHSLLDIVRDTPQLMEILQKKDCKD